MVGFFSFLFLEGLLLESVGATRDLQPGAAVRRLPRGATFPFHVLAISAINPKRRSTGRTQKKGPASAGLVFLFFFYFFKGGGGGAPFE